MKKIITTPMIKKETHFIDDNLFKVWINNKKVLNQLSSINDLSLNELKELWYIFISFYNSIKKNNSSNLISFYSIFNIYKDMLVSNILAKDSSFSPSINPPVKTYEDKLLNLRKDFSKKVFEEIRTAIYNNDYSGILIDDDKRKYLSDYLKSELKFSEPMNRFFKKAIEESGDELWKFRIIKCVSSIKELEKKGVLLDQSNEFSNILVSQKKTEPK